MHSLKYVKVTKRYSRLSLAWGEVLEHFDNVSEVMIYGVYINTYIIIGVLVLEDPQGPIYSCP